MALRAISVKSLPTDPNAGVGFHVNAERCKRSGREDPAIGPGMSNAIHLYRFCALI